MRLLRALRAVYHGKLALWHRAACERHADRADVVLAEIRIRQLTDASGDGPHVAPVERLLLASIIGIAIAALWIWISARAGR